MLDKIKAYWKEHDMDRFVPWRRRVCNHCGYPMSERVMESITASGKRKYVYCCNICYELRENKAIPMEVFAE